MKCKRKRGQSSHAPSQPDGYTSIFTAGAKVICGQKYHIKLALSDVGDDAFDSYVFLEAKSFKSTGVTFSSTIKDINGKILSNNYITEGCSEAILTFLIDFLYQRNQLD